MKAIKHISLALLLLLTCVGSAAASDLWLHVHVDEGEDGAQVRVNLPLSVAEKALAMIPEQELENGRIQIDDTDFSIAELRELWRSVTDLDDVVFVDIDDKDQRLQVRKEDGYLRVATVESRNGEHIDARLPLEVVEALLSGEGNEIDLMGALRALADRGEGELVTVTDNDTHVRVWVDRFAEAR
ncbi:MAG: hypothetical protein AAF481_07695 [Acidobacteriota bacterium]